MRYPAHEKLEIILLADNTHQPFKRTLEDLGIPRSTFYVWYDHYCKSGVEAFEDQKSHPAQI